MLLKAGRFERAYEVIVIDSPSAGRSDFEFTAGATHGQVTTLLVQPRDAADWTGAFTGDFSWRGVGGIFETPSPTWMCFVDRGTAFLVDVLEPSHTAVIPTDGPVRSVVPLLEGRLLLLGTPWAVTAIGDGAPPVWTTKRISTEALRLDEIVGHQILGVADPDDDEPREFAIDLRSGAVEGGAARF